MGNFELIASIRMNAEKDSGKDRKGGFSMKGKILIVGLIALLMAGALVLVGCRAGCEGAGTCEVDGQKGSICTNEKCAVWKATGTNKVKCNC